MSNTDDPARDKPRPAEANPIKKPHATLDLKATEIASKDADPPAFASASKPAEAGRAADTAAKSFTPAGATAGATKAPPPPLAAARPSAKPPRRGGVLSHLAAGLVGGLLVLLGAESLVPWLGLPDGFLQSGAADVQKRLGALEAQSRGAALAELTQKLAQSDSRLSRVEEQASSLPQLAQASIRLVAETKALQEKIEQNSGAEALTRLAKLEDMLAMLSSASQNDPPGRLPQLVALSVRIKELEGSIATHSAALRRDLTAALETRTSQAAEAGEVARTATQRIDRDLSAVKTDSALLIQRMEALKADSDRVVQTLRVVQQETGAIRSGLDGLKGDVESGLKTMARPNDVTAALSPLTTRLAALETSLQAVVKSEDDRRANTERIVLSLELANLKRVLDRGQRYDAELAEVKKAAGSKVDLAPLERYKAQGVPTMADLGRDFRAITNAILDADTEPADGNVVDRLLAGAKSIVRIRKVDHRAGDKSAEAVVGRMEAALKEGRLAVVIEEAKLLAPRSAAGALDWLDRVEARNSVDRAIATIEAQLKTSLSGATPAAAAGGKAQN